MTDVERLVHFIGSFTSPHPVSSQNTNQSQCIQIRTSRFNSNKKINVSLFCINMAQFRGSLWDPTWYPRWGITRFNFMPQYGIAHFNFMSQHEIARFNKKSNIIIRVLLIFFVFSLISDSVTAALINDSYFFTEINLSFCSDEKISILSVLN